MHCTMKFDEGYLVVLMFLLHVGEAEDSEVKHQKKWQLSREIKQGVLVRSELDRGQMKTLQRYLHRRSVDESGKKSDWFEEDVQINSTVDYNSTAQKLIGTDPITKKAKPLFSGIPPSHSVCPKLHESCENKCFNGTQLTASYRELVPLCNCDVSCNDIFMDCCSDYTKHCTSNTVIRRDPVYEAKSYLQCESKLGLLVEPCKSPAGVWMIKKCPTTWSGKIIRHKCEEPTILLDNRTYDELVPVYSRVNNLTYRNQYCAICHNMMSYEFWELAFWEQAIPPSRFNEEDFARFLCSNLQYFRGIKAKASFYVRYCYFPDIVQYCPNSKQFQNTECVNGSVEIVHSNDIAYKNRACSSCHNVKIPCAVQAVSSGDCFMFPGLISRTVDLKDYGVAKVTNLCPVGQVYDPYVSTCRPSYQPSILNSSVDSYKFVMSVLRYSSTPFLLGDQFQEIIARNFNFSKCQVKDVVLAKLNAEFRVSFTLSLTPLQSLMVSSSDVRNQENRKLFKLLKFDKPFRLYLNGGVNLTVFRVNVRRVACIHWVVYRYYEYTLFQDRRLFVNKTKLTYAENEYALSGPPDKPNATVCRKLVPFRINGSYIRLNPSNYKLLPNLSIVYRSSRYDFGEYSYINGTVYIFVAYQREYEAQHYFVKGVTALDILSFVSFILSEMFLIALIITYLIFKELRTLPGKNLLSLAVSLAVADLLWLFSSQFTDEDTLCSALAIANHYFFLVYFISCSVVAYHSCVVFGRRITLRPRKEEENRTFIVYFLLTWLVPALFVGLFAILDGTGTVNVSYGSMGQVACFIGKRIAKIYSFILPVGLCLVFNVTMFIFVAKRFFKNQNLQFLSSELQKKRDRENVLICVRLSTLMGFTWLFVFLHLLFKSVTDAFIYFFVVFVSLQGVFVGVAFIFNHKCLALYRELVHTNLNRLTTYWNTTSTANSTNSIYQDTKL